MITVQIKVKWYDYWTKKYGPKQHHYSSIVGENTKLDTDEYKSDGVFCLKINADWKSSQRSGLKTVAVIMASIAVLTADSIFSSGTEKKLLKEFEWKERPGKEGLLAQKVHIENWIKQCIELSKVDILK